MKYIDIWNALTDYTDLFNRAFTRAFIYNLVNPKKVMTSAYYIDCSGLMCSVCKKATGDSKYCRYNIPKSKFNAYHKKRRQLYTEYLQTEYNINLKSLRRKSMEPKAEALYKKGDKILLHKELIQDDYTSDMKEYCGKYMTIEGGPYWHNIFQIYYYIFKEDNYKFCWHENQIDRKLSIDISYNLQNILMKWNEEKFKEIITTIDFEKLGINHFDIAIDDICKLAYIPKDKEKYFYCTESGTYNFFNNSLRKKYAVMTRPGRLLNKIIKDSSIEITKEDVEQLQALLISQITLKFELVSGNDITSYYHKDNYCICDDKSTGSLADSCMRHDECQEYFGLYEDNAKMLILKCNDCNNILGRALVWENVHDKLTNKTITFMDRIYGSEQTINLFKNYAIQNNWYYKSCQCYGSSHITDPTRQSGEAYMSIKIKGIDYEYFPFLDTFAFIYIDDDDIYLVNDNYHNAGVNFCYMYELRETDGTREN